MGQKYGKRRKVLFDTRSSENILSHFHNTDGSDVSFIQLSLKNNHVTLSSF